MAWRLVNNRQQSTAYVVHYVLCETMIQQSQSDTVDTTHLLISQSPRQTDSLSVVANECKLNRSCV